MTLQRGPNHKLFQPEQHLVTAILAAPSAKLLRQLFHERAPRWNGTYLSGERDFTLFEDLFSGLSPHSAFTLLPVAAELVLEASVPERIEQAAYLLNGLARRSDTTEMPAGLANRWKQVLNNVEAAAAYSRDVRRELEDLKRWYRRDA